MADSSLRTCGNDDEVPVPRGDLVELRQHLLALGATLHPLDPLLGLPRSEVEACHDHLLLVLRDRAAMGNRVKKRPRGICRLELGIEVWPTCCRDDGGTPLTDLGVDETARTVEATAGDACDRRRLDFVQPGLFDGEPVSHGALGKAPERDELAAGANRLRDRAELVGDQHDRRVQRGLLEILEQRIGGVVVEQVRGEQEVHAALRLERPQVQVVVKLADDVDPDHVAERLDNPQVGVRAVDDAAGVAEPRPCECEGGVRLPHSCRPVEEEGVLRRRRPGAAVSNRLASFCSGSEVEWPHRSPRQAGQDLAVPSTTTKRPGSRSASCR